MIYQGRVSRRAAQVARSQLAVRLALAIYALLVAAIVLRCTVLIINFPQTVWSIEIILDVSRPVVFPLAVVPGANRAVIGSFTLADLTTALIVLAVSIAFLGRRRRS